jgi:NAD-dependent deacetylase
LVELESDFEVQIITQNVDDLHERAGSKSVLHLHGELTKGCNESKSVIADIGYKEIELGEQLDGTQMRPFIVWFGEAVPAMDEAIKLTQQADVFIVVGTSLNVYPAAGLLDFVCRGVPIYLIDPNNVNSKHAFVHYKESASVGVQIFKQTLLKTKDSI